MKNELLTTQMLMSYKPTPAYVAASWVALGIGVIAFLFGLWNASGLVLSEKGYYLAVLSLGLYAAISLQKVVRDKAEGIKTSDLYYGISWGALGLSIVLIAVGLWNAIGLNLSERGFYLMAFTLSLFAAITIQKNTRDLARFNNQQTPNSVNDKPRGAELTKNSKDSTKSLFGSLTANNSDKTPNNDSI